MVSINAENVAKDVLETVRKGKRIKFGEIIKRNGYSDITATVPTQVTNTKSYKRVMLPIVKQLENERQRVMSAMREKDLDEVQYDKLADVLDKITKNHQLLSGGATENIAIRGVEISIRK